MKRISLPWIAWRGLSYHWRIHSGVFLGILLSTAIVTGALILGDSARHTLRSIALSRLAGASQACYYPNRFLADDFATALSDEEHSMPASLLMLQGMALPSAAGGGASSQKRVNKVQILGVDKHFWEIAGAEAPQWQAQEVLINHKLARELGVGAGDRLALRVVKPSLMALDAPLSPGGDETAIRVQVQVKAVLADEEGGRFNLSNEQASPYTVFVPLQWLQELVDLEGKCNLLLTADDWSDEQLQHRVEEAWRLKDVGLTLRQIPDGRAQLESARIFLEEEVASAALSLPTAKGSLTYLVNAISNEQYTTPYSFALASDEYAALQDDEALINSWLAEKMQLQEGDAVTVRWFVVTPANEFIERSQVFKIKTIRPMDELEGERDLLPEFPGLTDVTSCTDWDVGMPMDEEALKDRDNEDYWDEWKQTPKLWVNLKSGQAMWGSRFGDYTAVTFSTDGVEGAALEEQLRKAISPEALGLHFRPVREEALTSVAEALDLGHLFLGMSFFLILSAVLLAILLFVFSLQQRAGEMGALLTLGFSNSHLRHLFSLEVAGLALVGGGPGVLAGTGYARLLLLGLSRAWAGAVAGTELIFHLNPLTLLWGLLAGAGLPLVVALWMLSRQCRRPASELLHRDFSQEKFVQASPGKKKRGWILSVFAFLAGLAVIIAVLVTEPTSLAPWFFGSGAWLLAVGVYSWRHFLKHYGSTETAGTFSLNHLALLQLTRRPGRNTTAVALLASGVFLALSVISMQEDLQKHAEEPWSGTGGFALFGETTASLSEAPDYPGIHATALRLREGDDAGCLNLNRAASPRIYGVDPEVLRGSAAFDRNTGVDNIWTLLQQPQSDGAIPALVGDRDTVMWGLNARAHPTKGDTLLYLDEFGNEVNLRLVGALPMRLSVFQGSILISLDDFTRHFPSESGFRAFLFDLHGISPKEAIQTLHQKEGKAGMQVETSLQRLEKFYTVERAYLHMFLLLGALGVTLGALGLGVITARSRVERRGEWAMLQALGFGGTVLRRLLFLELATILMVAGVLGGGASLIALLPSLLLSSTLPPLSLQLLGFCVMILSGGLSSAIALAATRSWSILNDLRRE